MISTTLRLVVAVGLLIANTDSLFSQQRRILYGHTDYVYDIHFSPDGTRLVSGSEDGTARIWNAKTGEEIALLKHEGSVRRVRFVPPGDLLVTAAETSTPLLISTSVRIWEPDPSTGTYSCRVLPGGTGRDVFDIAVSPDGRRLVASVNSPDRSIVSNVRVWELPKAESCELLRDSDSVTDLEFSPDGQYLVATGTFGGRPYKGAVLIWDAARFENPRLIKNQGGNLRVSFSHDSRLIAVTAQKPKARSKPRQSEVRLLRVPGGKEIGVLGGFLGYISELRFSRDNRFLAATAIRLGEWGLVPDEVVKLWDVQTGQSWVLSFERCTASLDFSPDGRTLAISLTTPRPEIQFFDTANWQVTAAVPNGEPPDAIMQLLYSPGGEYLAATLRVRDDTRGDWLSIWDLPTQSDSLRSAK